MSERAIDSSAAHLLWRHITCGSHHHARFCGLRHGGQCSVGSGFGRIGLSEFRQAKIQNLDPSIFSEE